MMRSRQPSDGHTEKMARALDPKGIPDDNDLNESLLGPSADTEPIDDPERRAILLVGLAILFCRYSIATFLSPFFSPYAESLDISGWMVGLIFSSYPLGITVTSMFSSSLVVKLGTKLTVTIGLCSTIVFTVLCGLVPTLLNDSSHLQYGFLVTFGLSGLGGALAEMASIVVISQRYPDKLGATMATVGTVSGIGCMAGPPIGGLLYSLGSDAGSGFRIAFLSFGFLPVLLVPIVLHVMPGPIAAKNEVKAVSMSAYMSTSFALSTLAIALSGTIVATLDVTLSYHLSAPPFGWSAGIIGTMFMISSIAYVATSIPVGVVVDKYPDSPKTYKAVQAVGLLVLALAFVMLGPLKIGSSLDSGKIFDNKPATVIAMLLKGLGSAGNNAACKFAWPIAQ
jgi:MFS family permease